MEMILKFWPAPAVPHQDRDLPGAPTTDPVAVPCGVVVLFRRPVDPPIVKGRADFSNFLDQLATDLLPVPPIGNGQGNITYPCPRLNRRRSCGCRTPGDGAEPLMQHPLALAMVGRGPE